MLYTFFFISPRFTPQKITSNISCSLVIFVTKKKAQPKITITHLHFTPHSPSPASHPEVDFSSGWIYCMKDSAGPWPAEGRWSSEGTSDPNGAPWCGKSPTFEQDSHGLDWWLDIIFTYHKLNTYGKNPTIYIYTSYIYRYNIYTMFVSHGPISVMGMFNGWYPTHWTKRFFGNDEKTRLEDLQVSSWLMSILAFEKVGESSMKTRSCTPDIYTYIDIWLWYNIDARYICYQ